MLERFRRCACLIGSIEYLVPSDEMLIEVLETLPTEADVHTVINLSNQWVEQHPQYLWLTEVIEERCLWREVCIRLGISHYALLLAQFENHWYVCLHMHFAGHQYHYQAVSDCLAHAKDLYSGKNPPRSEPLDWLVKRTKNNPLNRFNGYRKATQQMNWALDLLVTASRSDLVCEYYVRALLDLKKAEAYEDHRGRENENPSWTQCKHCGRIFSYSASAKKIPPDCGDSICENETQRLKPSKQKRGKKSFLIQAGFVKGNKGLCGGSCHSEDRLLWSKEGTANTPMCKDCTLESLSE